jgi:hypothetical protein
VPVVTPAADTEQRQGDGLATAKKKRSDDKTKSKGERSFLCAIWQVAIGNVRAKSPQTVSRENDCRFKSSADLAGERHPANLFVTGKFFFVWAIDSSPWQATNRDRASFYRRRRRIFVRFWLE